MSFQSLSWSSSRRLFSLLHSSRPRPLPHSIGAFRESQTTQRRSCVALGIQERKKDLDSTPAREVHLSSVISSTHSYASADTTTTTSLISAGPDLARCSLPEHSKELQADEDYLRKREREKKRKARRCYLQLYTRSPLVQMTPITKAYLILATIIT